IKPNIIRPFPAKEIANTLRNIDNLIVGERCDMPGSDISIIYGEILNIIQKNSYQIESTNLIYGLGGNELFAKDIEEIFLKVMKEKISTKLFWGVKPGIESLSNIIVRPEN